MPSSVTRRLGLREVLARTYVRYVGSTTFRLTIDLDDPSELPRIIRDVAERIETAAANHKIGGSLLDDAGNVVGAYALVDDDEAWQGTMRAQLDGGDPL